MAQQSSRNQYVRYFTPFSPVVSTSAVGSIVQYNNDLANKSDVESIYEPVNLGTHYSSAIYAFSQRLQSKPYDLEKLNEKISIIQRLFQESHMKIEAIKQENRKLKSLLNSSFRLPTPLDRDATQILEEQDRLKNEAKSFKFL